MIYFELESNGIAAMVYNSHKDAFLKYVKSRSIMVQQKGHIQFS